MTNNHKLARMAAIPAALLSFFISWPVFFDLNGLDLVYSNIPFMFDVSIPMPVGMVVVFLQAVTFYACASVDEKGYFRLLKPSKAILMLFSMVGPIVIYLSLVSGLGFTRIVQVMMPLLGLAIVALPLDGKVKKVWSFSYLLGFLIFSSLHLVSLSYQESTGRVDEAAFAMFFEFGIYQSHVSYPGVITLVLLGALAVALISDGLPKSTKVVAALSVFSALILVMAATRRASLLELVIIYSIFSFFAFYRVLTLLVAPKSSSLLILFFYLIFSGIFLWLVFDSPMLERTLDSYKEGRVDGGRFIIFANAISTLLGDWRGLLFGFGGDGVVGYHNYLLDTIYRVGLLAIIVMIAAVLILLRLFFYKLKSVLPKSKSKLFFVAALLGCVGIQVMVNAPLAQPYYMANMWACFCLIYFYSSTQKQLSQEANEEAV